MTTDWLHPDGAPHTAPWLVAADDTELICHGCFEDEGCCECATPDLVTPLEHKTRIWRDRVAYAAAQGLDPVDLSPLADARATGT